MVSGTEPLISCIMPTYNRREFIPHAIRYFLRQEYPNKELIVIDDGTDTVQDLIPDNPLIRYIYLDKKITLGAKLNMACSSAKGEIIVHWDDDDWYAPWRIHYQKDVLDNERTDLCGINNLLYYDLRNKKAFKYIYPSNQRVWLLGSSLCYKKKLWCKNQFADIDVGMDGLFVWATPPERISVLTDHSFSVHMIHDYNVSPKKTDGAWWHKHPVEHIQEIMCKDWDLYHAKEPANSTRQNGTFTGVAQHTSQKQSPKQIQNIYACLVHENEDCIIDLVRNLHYHDPSSVILLYNGSQDRRLISNRFCFDQFRAALVPDPIPVKHGYLHEFALRTMQFALEHYSFDTITIVDSDQLAIRKGYSVYLTAFFASRSNIGMLSSAPEKITADNKTNFVALQAFKELNLWKPFLANFPDGEDKFVHWTFWPATVFTQPAVRDLVKIFRESEQLRDIIAQSKIWASEEVILPTLVRLLGYEIALNPCRYDYVRFRKAYSMNEVNEALNKPDAFWIHPVPRKYDDTLRILLREHGQQYSCNTGVESSDYLLPGESQHTSLINRIRKIEGWLSDREAELLISVTLHVCRHLPGPQVIAEIGSYHGKTTVLFGSIIKACAAQAKVYAIDTHDGRLGAVDQGLQTFPPSFEPFKRNLVNAAVCDVVEIIQDRSYNLKWDQPVSLFFIDGLHDYLNVSTDFRHFAEWIVPGGYVAFHDYASYFPGVQTFVNELIRTGEYQRTGLVDSLILLQKR
ncbi:MULTISPECIES: glycosyltransferase [Niastella]|uniref:Glycosyltransferase n=1 Tax=Niastella soli TaxID=2821487 RepID=A0ABS3Z5Q8_9BACT|nr:glycosyltransferase [Niastella soli]MBO9205508.1 glycosyltransferase [Niastella soli]